MNKTCARCHGTFAVPAGNPGAAKCYACFVTPYGVTVPDRAGQPCPEA